MHPLMLNDAESPDSPIDVCDTFANIPVVAETVTATEPVTSTSTATATASVERQSDWQTTTPLASQLDQLAVSSGKGPSRMSSGESEPDISQYQASVEPTYQSVSMVNSGPSGSGLAVPKASNRRRISLTSELRNKFDDDSSIDTVSNNSFDGEDSDPIDDFGGKLYVEQPQATVSGASSQNSPAANATSARDGSAKDPSNAVTLSDGQTRDIDMKVIEPYKRCLSHGGYIQSPGDNAIVIFSACYLPDRSRADYNYVMENLFL